MKIYQRLITWPERRRLLKQLDRLANELTTAGRRQDRAASAAISDQWLATYEQLKALQGTYK